MAKPITPLCGCDVFILDEVGRLLLIRRSDTGLWALPGGCQELGDTPARAAIRECREETGFDIELTELLGVWSSLNYTYEHYPWKENVFTHLLFAGRPVGGELRPSEESPEVGWFAFDELPTLCDGHAIRIQFGISWSRDKMIRPHFE